MVTGGGTGRPEQGRRTSIPGAGGPDSTAQSCTPDFGGAAPSIPIQATVHYLRKGNKFPFLQVAWQQIHALSWIWAGISFCPFQPRVWTASSFCFCVHEQRSEWEKMMSAIRKHQKKKWQKLGWIIIKKLSPERGVGIPMLPVHKTREHLAKLHNKRTWACTLYSRNGLRIAICD